MNAFTFNGIEVSGLADPIVGAAAAIVAAPSLEEQRRQQRRLGRTGMGLGLKGLRAVGLCELWGTNVTKLEATHTSRTSHAPSIVEPSTSWKI